MSYPVSTESLSLVLRMCPGVCFATYVPKTADSGQANPPCAPSDARVDAAACAVGRQAAEASDTVVQASGDDEYFIACPLDAPDGSGGAVLVYVRRVDQQQADVVAQLLRWACEWMALVPSADGGAALALSRNALGADDADAAFNAICRDLRVFFGGSRVALGLANGHSVALTALSDRDAFDARAEPVAALNAAMNEAWDQAACVSWPSDTPQTVALAHEQVGRATQSTVFSTPVATSSGTVAVVTLMRPVDRPFTNAERTRLIEWAPMLGDLIATRQAAARTAGQRLRSDLRATFKGRFADQPLHRRVLVAAAGLFAAVVLLGQGTYEVKATAELAGTSERLLSSPVDGYLADVHARVGARVQAGDVLATLDREPLERQRRELVSRFEQLTGEYSVALARLDGAEARIKQAQMAQARVRLDHLDAQMSRLDIVAPFDGLVLAGDLLQARGGPVRQGDTLFRLAPQGDYVVRLQVNERDAAALIEGSRGRLKLAALPGAELDLEITRMDGMARSVDGRGVLEMEALIDGDQAFLRPGMKGVARLHAGKARRIWLWTHATAQRLSLFFWRYSPVA